MYLRIGFDMDGTLADLATAYQEIEARLFPSPASAHTGNPEEEAVEETEDNRRLEETQRVDDGRRVDHTRGNTDGTRTKARRPSEQRRRRDRVWNAIQETPDFWTTLKPLDPTAVRRIHDLMLQHRWEVFFITQRPATEGDTVQRQTQRWLVKHGFDFPSVLVIPDSRGAAAGALRLDYHVDDNTKNCIDVKADSGAKPLLIVDSSDDMTASSARRLGIGTAHTIGECLTILEQASVNRTQPNLLHRLAKLVGWN